MYRDHGSPLPMTANGLARRLSAAAISFILHLLAAMMTVWVATRLSLVPMTGGNPSGWSVVMVTDAAIVRDEPADSEVSEPTPDDLGIRVEDGSSDVSLPGFTFDYTQVANRGSSLFPFLSGRLSLERIVGAKSRKGSTGLANPFAHDRRRNAVKPPLVIGDAERQALLDKTWSRRDRWHAFQPIAALVEPYSPDDGALPTLLKAYGAQNGLQPYADTAIRDPRLWVQLGLATNHIDFIDFISRYASRHPSTKATIELLFLLEEMVQGSFNALTVLLETDPSTELTWTRKVNNDAYEAVVKIRDYYRVQLDRRELASPDTLKAHYDAVRLAILTTILDTTPNAYRASDARFLMGAIFWKQGKKRDALGWWSALTIHPEDRYVTAYSAILTELRSPNGPPTTRHIDRILEAEHARWVSTSFDRLRQFGFRFDTF
jgi:hypothetical protein